MRRAATYAILVLIFVLAPLLTACESTKYVATSVPFCAAVKPVCVSKDDQLTEGTASQVEANNLGHARVCKPKPGVCSAQTPK